MKTLYVKYITTLELAKQWGFLPPPGIGNYVKCNKQGEVNWNKASVYTSKELLDRGNVVAIVEGSRFKIEEIE